MFKIILAIIFIFPAVVLSQSGSVDVPFLSGGGGTRDASSTITTFDKLIRISTPTSDPRGAETYLYINTRNGDMGIVTGPSGTLGDGTLQTNDPNFRLMLITGSGAVLNFFNRLKNGDVVHYVASGNTEMAPVMFAPSNTELIRRGGSDTYRDDSLGRRGRVTGQAYAAAGPSSPTAFIVGTTSHRRHRQLVAQKLLGYSGIGYLKTDKGVFMVRELRSGAASFVAENWQDMNTSFDKAPFVLVEQKLFDGIRQSDDRRLEGLRNKEFSGECSEYESALNEIQQRIITRRADAVNRAQSGNVYQNPGTVRGYVDLYDYSGQLEAADMDAQLRTCRAERDRSGRSTSSEAFNRLSERIRCLQNYRNEIRGIKLEIDTIDANNASRPDRGLAQKQRAMARLPIRPCR